VSSYLFDEPTHLNDIHWRDGNRIEQFWTTQQVSGTRYGQHKLVYVLTSKRTFSAAEQFSYELKNLKRATIIGETTGGGAHANTLRRLNSHFAVSVPNGRAISPITKTDWEGVGVVPNVNVPAQNALNVAQAMALSKLIQLEKNKLRKDKLRKRLDEINREDAAIPERSSVTERGEGKVLHEHIQVFSPGSIKTMSNGRRSATSSRRWTTAMRLFGRAGSLRNA
jgi:hypothetical protein